MDTLTFVSELLPWIKRCHSFKMMYFAGMLKVGEYHLKALFCCFFLLMLGCAHKRPYHKEVATFLAQDRISAPPKNGILFVGSSSIENWKSLGKDFVGFPVINRGLWGATIPDLLLYVNEIVIPYQPKQVFIYCGENDFAAADSVTAEIVFERFQRLHQLIRAGLPNSEIIYISLKPSPNRWVIEDRIVQCNSLIESYIKKQPLSVFINIHQAMLLDDGRVNPELFIEDRLHMNAKGYAIWQKIILPYLKH